MTRKTWFFWFIHHCVRPLWNYPIKCLYYLIYKIKLRKPKYYEIYSQHKKEYDRLVSLTDLDIYMRRNYKYKYDGPSGIFDHDNTENEFFTNWGDCDDVANFALKYLKKNPKLFPVCKKIGLKGLYLNSLHYDVYFEGLGKCYLFNYGNNIIGKDLIDCIDQLEKKFNMDFPKGKTKYWNCKY